MALIITLVLLTVWAALMINVYSIFEPFLNNLRDVKDYNIAYYWAVSSIERANLVLRHHIAWFEWSGWWLGNSSFWPNSDAFSWAYWVLYNPNSKNWISWTITSLNTWWTIPKVWFGNVDFDLQWSDSKNYNKLEYNISEEVLLHKDPTTSTADYYGWITTTQKITPINIFTQFRLPPKIEAWYNSWTPRPLDTTKDSDWDWIWNDNLINRTIFGKHWWNNLIFYPTINVDYATSTLNANLDSWIRESHIGENWTVKTINFTNNFNPTNLLSSQWLYTHNMNPTVSAFNNSNRRNIISNANFTDIHLKYSLVNFIEVANNYIYPFLEYKIEFKDNSNNPITIPDRFFNVSWIWQVWRYKVTLKQSIPVVKSYWFSDFTIIF